MVTCHYTEVLKNNLREFAVNNDIIQYEIQYGP